MIDDDSFGFRQKGAGVPRGMDSTAEDADPSPESGGARLGAPVWRQFVANEAFQDEQAGAIKAEQEYQQRTARTNAQIQHQQGETWGGDNGRLLRKVGKRIEQHDPNGFVDHPVIGPVARKSLWDREVRTARTTHEALGLKLQDPKAQEARLSPKQREETTQEISAWDSSAADKASDETARQQAKTEADKLRARLASADRVEQMHADAYKAKQRAFELENTDPEAWWQSRPTPTAQDQRQQVVGEVQTKRPEIAAAHDSAASEMAELRTKLATGVKGPEADAAQARMAELAAASAKIADVAQANETKLETVKTAAKPPEKSFFGFSDAVSGIWDAVKGLGVTAPAAFYQLTEGMERPDKYSDSAKAAFAAADAFQKEMQAKTDANQAAGTSTSVGESFREAGGSLGFSLGSMAAAIPASIVGAKVGALVGGAGGATVGGVGAVPGAGVGAAIGGVSAGMAASGTASYRMAGASFLNESFSQLEAESMRKNGRPMNEEEKQSSLEALLPIAKNTALWEAGPEAVGNAVTLGAGKIIFGLGKPLAAKFAKSISGKAVAAGGALATELGTETLTQVEQSADQKKADAITQGQDPSAIKADWSAGGVVEAFKEVAPQTLALMGLMGGAGGAIKVASKVTGIGGQKEALPEDPTEPVNAHIASIDPEAPPVEPEELSKAVLIHDPASGAEGVGEAVLIERELKDVEAADAQAVADAQAAHDAILPTGDKPGTAAAVATLEQAKAAAGRADLVRAVLKINGGKTPQELTDAEVRSLGVTRDGKPLPKAELKAVGLERPLVDFSADGTPIIRDEALKQVEATSPRARAQIKLSEAEQIAWVNTPTWTVGLADGRSITVRAKDAASAELEAAGNADAQIVIGSARQVSNEPNNQGSTKNQGGTAAQVPVPPVSTGAGGTTNGGVAGGGAAAADPAQAQAAAAVKTAKALVKRARKNKRLAETLKEGNARAQATPDSIEINPGALIAEALDAGMNPTQAVQFFERVLDEEIRHLAQYDAARSLWEKAGKPGGFKPWMDAHYAAIWQTEFVATGKADTARMLYAKDDAATQARWDAMADGDKALEAIRMMSQGDNITEAASLWLDIGQSLRDALEAALVALKQFIDTASPAILSEIKNLENALKQLKKQDIRNRQKKPAAGKASAGTGAAPEANGAGATSGDGGAVPPPSGRAGSPVVGQRVTFIRDGEELSGVVAIGEKDGQVSVRLDKPDSEGVPTRLVAVGELRFPTVKESLTVEPEAPAEAKPEKLDLERLANQRAEIIGQLIDKPVVVESIKNTPNSAHLTVMDELRKMLPWMLKNGMTGGEYEYFQKHVENHQWVAEVIRDIGNRISKEQSPAPSPAPTPNPNPQTNGSQEKADAQAQEGQVLNQAPGVQAPGALVPQDESTLVAGKWNPNSVVFAAVSFPNYEPLGIIQVQHDGTPEAIGKARETAMIEAERKFGTGISNSASMSVSTDEAGRVSHMVSANGKLSKIDSPDARYAAGDINAYRDDSLKRIQAAKKAGNPDEADAIAQERIDDLEKQISEIGHDESKPEDSLDPSGRSIRKYVGDMRAEIVKWKSLMTRDANTSTTSPGPDTYAKRVRTNLEHMGSTPEEWSVVPFTGREIDNPDGGRPLIEQDYSSVQGDGWKPAPTLYKSDGQTGTCGWCGKTPVKFMFGVKNDSRKWSMMVGSECVTHFSEKSGEGHSKDAKASFNRAAWQSLHNAVLEIKRELSYSQSDAYGRQTTTWESGEARDLATKASTLLGKLDIKNSSDGAFTAWNHKSGKAADEIVTKLRDALQSDGAKKFRVRRRLGRISDLKAENERGASSYSIGTGSTRQPINDHQKMRNQQSIEKLQKEIDGIEGKIEGLQAAPLPETQSEKISTVRTRIETEFPKIAAMVDVVESPEAVPRHLKDHAQKNGIQIESITAVFDPKTNRVTVVASAVEKDPQKVRDSMWHEVAIHQGLRTAMTTEARDAMLQEVYDGMTDSQRKSILTRDSSVLEEDHHHIAEEFLAYESERVMRDGKSNSTWTRIAGIIRSAIRSMGVSLKYTDSDIARLARVGMEASKKEVWKESNKSDSPVANPVIIPVQTGLNTLSDPERQGKTARFSLQPPVDIQKPKGKAWIEGLDEAARATFDFYNQFRKLEASVEKAPVFVWKYVEKGSPPGWKLYPQGGVLNRSLSHKEMNAFIAKNPHVRDTMIKAFHLMDAETSKEMGLTSNGLFQPGMMDRLGMHVYRSFMQRLMDARNSIKMREIDARYAIGDTEKSVNIAPDGSATTHMQVDESYRRSILEERRRQYKAGEISTASPGVMSYDSWGTMGFTASNQKTVGSGDLTTICPQMYINKGCFYCYRRSAFETNINNKLGAEKVWYTGEFLRLSSETVSNMNRLGGFRIQSFGDFFANDPQTRAMLVDMLHDSELVGLQVKIITKDPRMVDFIADVKGQRIEVSRGDGTKGIVGEHMFFNLSADYFLEPAGVPDKETGMPGVNVERPFDRYDSNGNEGEGEIYWKRALSIDEADAIAKEHPWVNIRTVALTVDEFLRGLTDPRVHVVTGYHGNVREYRRITLLDDGGKRMDVEVEPIGDSGMPRFDESGALVHSGDTKDQKKLAHAIARLGLQKEYERKACCITGRCASCKTLCGAPDSAKYTGGTSFAMGELLKESKATIQKVRQEYLALQMLSRVMGDTPKEFVERLTSEIEEGKTHHVPTLADIVRTQGPMRGPGVRSLKAAPLPSLRADSPEWKAMSTEGRKGYLSERKNKPKPVSGRVDAERLFADGKILYGVNEMDETMSEITSMEMLKSFPPDAIFWREPNGLQAAPLPSSDARYLELAKDPEKNAAELQRMVDETARNEVAFGKKVEPPDIEDFPKAGWMDRNGNIVEVPYEDTHNSTAAEILGFEVPTSYALEVEYYLRLIAKGWVSFADMHNGIRAMVRGSLTASQKKNLKDAALFKGGTLNVDQEKANIALVQKSDDGNIIPLSQRFNTKSDSILFSAPLPPVNPALAKEARAHQQWSGKNVSSGALAAFGSDATRKDLDVVTAIYEHEREVRTMAEALEVARKRLAGNPADIEAKLIDSVTTRQRNLDPADHLAIQLLIDQEMAKAGNDTTRQAENMARMLAYRKMRGDAGRLLQIGVDKFMSPAERALASLTEAIYAPTKRIGKLPEQMPYGEKSAIIKEECEKRIKEVEKALEKLGLKLSDIRDANQRMKLQNSELMREVLKLKTSLEQDFVKLIQKGWTIPEIERRYGRKVSEEVRAALSKARAELTAKLTAMMQRGMSDEEIRAELGDSLKAGPLGPSTGPSADEIKARIARMLVEDFGLPEEAPTKRKLPRTPKKEKPIETNPLEAQWSRPVFTDGMKSVAFDTTDRANVMQRFETIHDLAHAVGKISNLKDEKLAEANKLLAEIDAILAKYGTDTRGIFEASRPIEDYGFDMNDVVQVSAVARAIHAIDADIIDKVTEWCYASILSGLQTMAVNATAAGNLFWENSVGRGVEMAINHAIVHDPMGATLGEEKYILRAIGPALARAMNNARVSFAAQHPMFDRDVNAMEVDWDRATGGVGNQKMIGAIGGRFGDIVRIPMRVLVSTDDFNNTVFACSTVGCYAYRLAKKESVTKGSALFGRKPGSPEFDKFIRQMVNMPGSAAYLLASQKSRAGQFANPLPGQRDPTTGKQVPVNDVGDLFGWVGGQLSQIVNKEQETLLAKTIMAAFRVCFFPFQRTPFNILRKGIRYIPNPVSLIDILAVGNWQNKRVAGESMFSRKGWSKNLQGRNAELIERMAMQIQGAAAMLLLMGLGAGEGDEDDMKKPVVITGSMPWTPRGKAELDAQQRSGLGPYRISFRRKNGSERFGVNYGRVEPLATLGAGIIDLLKNVKRTIRGGGDASQAAGAALGGMAAQAKEKTFLRGFSDLVDLGTNLLAEPDLKDNRKAQQFVASRFAMAIPNLIKQPIRETDNHFRERSDGFMQELFYQVVPYGQKPEKMDPYGRVVEKTGTAAGRILDVTEAGTNPVNPMDAMLIRWRDKHPDKAWFPAAIVNAEWKNPRTGKEEKMTSDQLQEFRETAGKRAAALTKREVFNTANPSAMDVEKLKNLHTQARADAKKILTIKFAAQAQPK